MFHLESLNLTLEYMYLLVLVINGQVDPLIRVDLKDFYSFLGLSQLISHLTQLMVTLFILKAHSFLCLRIVAYF